MNSYKTDVLIIGGGAAGLFTAAALIRKYSKVGGSIPTFIIVEKMDRCGRKIAITGKGRCNVTNTKPWAEFSSHIYPKNSFFKSAFFSMDNNKTMEFFNEMGLDLVVERGDRVYPVSMRASDVTSAMLNYIKIDGGKLITRVSVVNVEREQSGNGFCTSLSNGSIISSKKVVVATGGLSYPATGSTGDGYAIAKSFGHKVTTCFPSLTALKPKDYRDDLQGISLKNVSLKLSVNGDVVAEEFGDIDFTNGGIEGPIGFKISRKAVWNLINGQKVEVALDLKPAVSLKQVTDRVSRELASIKSDSKGVTQLHSILPKLMPKQLIKPFLALNKDVSINNLPDKLKSWSFKIDGYVGYERCVITAGGVDLKEVSQKTMESKLVPGLYFAGEILDLDGDTGGYNLQIAFSTAALVAENL